LVEEEDIYGEDGVGVITIQSQNQPKAVSKPAASNVNSKYAEDWVPIKNILNGMIHLDSGEFVTGVKVSPRNIFILDQDSQDNIIFNLRTFYNVIDYEFWLIIADRPVDINIFLSQLQVRYNEAANPLVRKLIMQDINKANSFMSTQLNVVDTEYFILFKEKKMELIQKRINSLVSGLANCQLNSTQVTNEDLRMLIDNFFNGGFQAEFGTVMPQ